jgi:hypothetical protein
MVMTAGARYGFEFKYSDAPGRRRSMHTAIRDLGLKKLWVVYPGREAYELGDNIVASPLSNVLRVAARLKE